MPENFVENKILDQLPSSVRQSVLKLDIQKQAHFADDYTRKRKKIAVAYLTWILCYAHNVYLERGVGMWFLQILSCMAFIGLAWVVYDLFIIPGKVRDLNEDIARSILRDIKILQAD